MSPRRVLIAGVGNVFLGDDGFGVEVIRRLAEGAGFWRERPGCGDWPISGIAGSPQAGWRDSVSARVEVVDFGIRGLDLCYALLDNYDFVVLVDAALRGLPPGTIQVLEPDLSDRAPLDNALGTHDLVPNQAIEMARAQGAVITNLRVVSCEPATFGPVGVGCLGLSEPVARAVDEAVQVIQSLVAEFLCPCTNLR